MQLRARIEIRGIATTKKKLNYLRLAKISREHLFQHQVHFDQSYTSVAYAYMEICTTMLIHEKNGRREISKFCKCIAYSD